MPPIATFGASHVDTLFDRTERVAQKKGSDTHSISASMRTLPALTPCQPHSPNGQHPISRSDSGLFDPRARHFAIQPLRLSRPVPRRVRRWEWRFLHRGKIPRRHPRPRPGPRHRLTVPIEGCRMREGKQYLPEEFAAQFTDNCFLDDRQMDETEHVALPWRTPQRPHLVAAVTVARCARPIPLGV